MKDALERNEKKTNGGAVGIAFGQLLHTNKSEPVLGPKGEPLTLGAATNTGATTLQVGATIATNVFRRTTSGALALVGGEIIAGTLTGATYDGVQFQLLGAVTSVPIWRAGLSCRDCRASARPNCELAELREEERKEKMSANSALSVKEYGC